MLRGLQIRPECVHLHERQRQSLRPFPTHTPKVRVAFVWSGLFYCLHVVTWGARSESGYQWSQMLYDTTGNLLTSIEFSDPVQKMLQVHVCRNITKAMNSNCSAKGLAPVYMVSSPSIHPAFSIPLSLPPFL